MFKIIVSLAPNTKNVTLSSKCRKIHHKITKITTQKILNDKISKANTVITFESVKCPNNVYEMVSDPILTRVQTVRHAVPTMKVHDVTAKPLGQHCS